MSVVTLQFLRAAGLVCTALLATLAAFPARAASEALESITIPIFKVVDGRGVDCLALMVKLGTGEARLFRLDTASSGVLAAYEPADWKPVEERAPGRQTDGNRNHYEFAIGRTSVDLGSGAVARDIEIGRITEMEVHDSGARRTVRQPDATVDYAAQLNGLFCGYIGADLTAGGGFGLASVLAQMPGNLASGYIIRLGSNNPNETTQGTLTIGLTPILRAQFLTRLKLARQPGIKFPNGMPAWQRELNGTGTLRDATGREFAWPTPVIFDTSSPGMLVQAKDVPIPNSFLDATGRALAPGVMFIVTAHGSAPSWTPWRCSNLAGTPAAREVKVARDGLLLNPGMLPFSEYDVMFDLERGEIGLRRRLPSVSHYEIPLTPGRREFLVNWTDPLGAVFLLGPVCVFALGTYAWTQKVNSKYWGWIFSLMLLASIAATLVLGFDWINNFAFPLFDDDLWHGPTEDQIGDTPGIAFLFLIAVATFVGHALLFGRLGLGLLRMAKSRP